MFRMDIGFCTGTRSWALLDSNNVGSTSLGLANKIDRSSGSPILDAWSEDLKEGCGVLCRGEPRG